MILGSAEMRAIWERRRVGNGRFNPALALIVPCIDEGRVRMPDQPDHPVMGVLIVDEDIAARRAYVKRHTR